MIHFKDVVLPPQWEETCRRPADDWSGLASAPARRKIQNRINARLSRRRKALARSTTGCSGAAVPVLVSFREQSNARQAHHIVGTSHGSLEGIEEIDPGECAVSTMASCVAMAKLPVGAIEREVLRLHHRLHHPDPTTDLLLTLISFNVFRAFQSNLRTLQFDALSLADEECPSPFTLGAPSEHLPPDLQPTTLQRAIPHHAIYDVFPDRRLRERLIQSPSLQEDTDICRHIAGVPDAGASATDEPLGFIVWGEPCRIESWEVTQRFFDRWHYVVADCVELIASSNRWRARRGELPLHSPAKL